MKSILDRWLQRLTGTQSRSALSTSRERWEHELDRYRQWAATTPERFKSAEWEYFYDDWAAVYQTTERFLAAAGPQCLSESDIGNLLYCLARDNEGEHVGTMIGSRPDLLFLLADAARSSNEPDAKWQLSELLGQVVDRRDEAECLLLEFVRDDHEYVSRIALLALSSLQSDHLEPMAERAWKTDQEYQRIAALWALYAAGSPLLTEYVARARQDGREQVVRTATEVARMEAAKTA